MTGANTWILECSIRALLMAGGIALAARALRISAASVMHRAWTAAMLAMLLLPLWTEFGPSFTAPVLPAVREPAAASAMPPAAVGVFVDVFPVAAVQAARPVPAPATLDWRKILVAVYLAGFGIMLTRLIQGTLQIRGMMRRMHRDETFVTSSQCAAPVTIGWLRPMLVLPGNWRTWPAGKLSAVLIHEREHMRRRDPLVQWLALLNRCVFWFHPLAWWMERKLAALAEEACDAAVLAQGHAADDYARYLIEMARSVNRKGARIRWAGAVAFSAGKLPQRIRRIMDGPPVEAQMSRGKSAASIGLCALLLATLLACNLGRRPQPATASMGEQDRAVRSAVLQRQSQRQQSDADVWKAALSLTPANAKELEADVRAHPNYPEHPDNLLELVRYYQSRKDWKALDELTLWFIAQHPDVRVNWGYRPEWDQVWDQGGYTRGRELWAGLLQKAWSTPFVYMNAAEYLSGNDNEQAEQILLEGQRKFPSPALHWEVFLARHYAWALAGKEGQLPAGRMVVGYSESAAAPAQAAYAQKVRETLLASKDTELLTRTVEQLQGNSAHLELARSLVERALAIKPDDRTAHSQRKRLELFSLRLREKTNPGSLSDADRMELLQSELWGVNVSDREAEAKELLALALRNRNDPNMGTAFFLANMTLGVAALDRGDKTDAVQRLLNAAAAPPTEFLRYNQIDMSLARRLVDAGERDAVAKFLDQCAKFNHGGKPLAEWASLIRKGTNPDLSPHFDAFRQAQ